MKHGKANTNTGIESQEENEMNINQWFETINNENCNKDGRLETVRISVRWLETSYSPVNHGELVLQRAIQGFTGERQKAIHYTNLFG